jgi:hypothetical protein
LEDKERILRWLKSIALIKAKVKGTTQHQEFVELKEEIFKRWLIKEGLIDNDQDNPEREENYQVHQTILLNDEENVHQGILSNKKVKMSFKDPKIRNKLDIKMKELANEMHDRKLKEALGLDPYVKWPSNKYEIITRYVLANQDPSYHLE